MTTLVKAYRAHQSVMKTGFLENALKTRGISLPEFFFFKNKMTCDCDCDCSVFNFFGRAVDVALIVPCVVK